MTQWLIALAGYSSGVPRFNSQQPHGSSQPSVTAVPGNPTFSLGLCGHCILMIHRHLGRETTHIDINEKKFNQ